MCLYILSLFYFFRKENATDGIDWNYCAMFYKFTKNDSYLDHLRYEYIQRFHVLQSQALILSQVIIILQGSFQKQELLSS